MHHPFPVHARTDRIAALIVTSLAIVLASGTGTSAQGDRDCGDFEDHAAAVAWFESLGGSLDFNAGGLDGDRDGIPCEELIRSGPIARVLDTATGGHPTAGAIVLGSLALLLSGGLVLWLRKRRSVAARASDPAIPTPPASLEQGYRPIVPELREAATTGILVLTIELESGGPLSASLDIRLDDRAFEIDVPPNSTSCDHTVELPDGNYTLQITSTEPALAGSRAISVAKDDVTRETVQLGPVSRSPASSSQDASP